MKKVFFSVFLAAVAAGATELALNPERFTCGDSASVKQEKGALVVDLPAYDVNRKNTWPGVSTKLPRDCSAYTHVEISLKMSGGLAQSISVKLQDREKGRHFESFSIPDPNPQTLRIALHPQRLKRNNMSEMTVYQSRPPFASQFTISRIRLVDTTAEQLTPLKDAAEKIKDKELLAELKSLTPDTLEQFKRRLREKQIDAFLVSSQKRSGVENFAVGVASSLEKPMPFAGTFSVEVPTTARLSLARNEAENLQFLTVSREAIPKMSIKVSGFSKELEVVAAPVGTVEVTRSREPRAIMGSHFDPILEFTDSVSNLKPRQLQSWIVRFKSSADTPAGTYRGKVEFSALGETCVYPVDVTVRNFTLPPRPTLKTATSVYGSEVLGGHKKAMEKYILKNYHLNYFSIYSESGGYGKPQLPSIDEYLEAKKLGANFIPILYLKLPRQAHHTGLGFSPGKSKAEWEKLSPEAQRHYPVKWKEEYIRILSQRIPELKAAGLYDISACYGFDEATPSEWPAIAELLAGLKKHFPDLKVFSTAYDISYGERSVLGKDLDGWIPGIGTYRFDAARAARAKGRQVWYYTTRMTIDGDTLADIRGELGERAFANGVDGWLVWTVSRWYNNPKPITASPATGWNPESFPGDNGGGSYFCVGEGGRILPTVRAEAIRDGIEDYEYFTILKNRAAKLPPTDPLRMEAEKLLNMLPLKPHAAGTELLNRRESAAQLIERMK